eukprot:6426546-Prorocentrum_lima.AAC.1
MTSEQASRGNAKPSWVRDSAKKNFQDGGVYSLWEAFLGFQCLATYVMIAEMSCQREMNHPVSPVLG